MYFLGYVEAHLARTVAKLIIPKITSSTYVPSHRRRIRSDELLRGLKPCLDTPLGKGTHIFQRPLQDIYRHAYGGESQLADFRAL